VVITRIGVREVGATASCDAGVIGAYIPIVATHGFTTTDTVCADVVRRANISIVANSGVVGVDTAHRRIAGIIRARVPVIAGNRRAAADSRGADVGVGAHITIVAAARIRGVDTSRQRIAGIIRARVRIIAADRHGPGTGSRVASIIHKTRVAVVAAVRIRGVDTSRQRIAGIIRARVRIIAVHRDARADRASTYIIPRTRISVITAVSVGDEPAPRRCVAGVVCAHVAVIADEERSADARAIGADIVHCTGIVVAARVRIVGRQASCRRIAVIVRAIVPVVAVERDGANTNPAHTDIARSAGVSIVASVCVIRVDAPKIVVAGIIRAHISVGAIPGRPPACPVGAGVRLRTRVTIITRRSVVFENTSHNAVADVVRAWVSIGTLDGGSGTHTVRADVRLGARGPVVTGIVVRFVDTPIVEITRIIRAHVPVITVGQVDHAGVRIEVASLRCAGGIIARAIRV
jgi:hypothetical protein